MEISKGLVTAGLLMLAMFLTACGTDGKPAAVDINPEVDVCVYCNMAVPDNEHATQMILADRTVYKYDDIGCMIKHEAENTFDVAVAYVRDAHTQEWVDWEEATFFYEETIHTPMGYGVLSFQDAADAEAMLEQYPYGTVMSLEEVKHYVLNSNYQQPMDHQEADGSSDAHGHQEEMSHEVMSHESSGQ